MTGDGLSLPHITKLIVSMHGRDVGTLAETPDGRAAFQYSPEWLLDGFSISPFGLPLEDRLFIAKPQPLDGLFGVFDDSLPDGWGRLLVDRMLASHGIDPGEIGFLQRLAIVGSSGSGALVYRPEIELSRTEHIDDLDAIAKECASILSSSDSGDLDALFAMGGSSGGARPKVFYVIDEQEWIVKFPASVDPHDIGREEYELALAARECGIEMAEVRLLPSSRCSGYFATKRFDRVLSDTGEVRKVHMASVAALLDTSHRIPNLDYSLLMRLVLKLTDSMDEVVRMYRLMVFNVLSGNRDDHSKNFSFVHDSNGWKLSPAYDITKNPGINGERATTVNNKGRNITVEDILTVARDAGIGSSLATKTIELTRSVLGDRGLLGNPL